MPRRNGMPRRLALLALVATGCSTVAPAPPPLLPARASLHAAARTGGMPTLPWAGGQGETAPWGGSNAARWRPEAILANGASAALNEAWGLTDVRDATVAVPVKMYGSDFHPYGDGQANAVPAFMAWDQSRPPVVATLVHFRASAARVLFRFDRALPVRDGRFELHVRGKTLSLDATRDAAGDWTASWAPPAGLWDASNSRELALVRPAGWGDWFPLGFRLPTRPINEILATVPAGQRTFADGGPLVDHEHVSLQAGAGLRRRLQHVEDGPLLGASATEALVDGSQTPFQALLKHDFQGRYNATPYHPLDVHARFPYNGHDVVTGVGAGWTWVAQQPPAPFKVLYTAFERRRADMEASAPDGGVPSGGGWHRIGDPAETILNDLEAGPLVVGHATGNPLPASQLPSGGFAYQLSDVATVRWLQPGEAFTTRRGSASQPNYHWFCFQQPREVVTEEWVHPCVPDDADGFACGG